MELEKFFKEFGEKLKATIKNDFPKIRKEYGKEKPYAVAFVTDSDCTTLWLGINTCEFLKKADAEYSEDDDDYTTKWNPDEWGYSDESAQLVKLSDELYEKSRALIDEIENQTNDITTDELGKRIDESGFPQLFIKMVTTVFQELIQTDVFGLVPNEVTYFITMNDDERAIEIENTSAELLNSKELYVEFLKRKTYY